MRDELLDVAAVSGRLGVCPRLLYSREWRRRLRVPVVRVGRRVLFSARGLDAWVRLRSRVER